MSLVAAIFVAIAIAFGAPASAPAEQPVTAPTVEQDAWSSLESRGVAPVEQGGGCALENVRYVDSGEHGTTMGGEFSIWSISDEDLFHHFTCN